MAYARLAELGKTDLAYPTVLANYAVAQYRDGRRVGNRLNVREVLVEYAQRKKHFSVERLDRFDEADGEWKEAVVEDTRHAGVRPRLLRFASTSRTGCDTLRRRDRKIALTLAAGEKTGAWPACSACRRAGSRSFAANCTMLGAGSKAKSPRQAALLRRLRDRVGIGGALAGRLAPDLGQGGLRGDG